MIYDLELRLYRLEGGTPITGSLKKVDDYFYGEMEVYHKRYWEAVQAGDTIDTMAEIPEHLSGDGELYVKLADDNIYRVVQLQRSWDENRLPVSILSLSRDNRRLNILDKE